MSTRFLFLAILTCFANVLSAQIVSIPDSLFKAALLNHNPVIDLNGDGEIQVSEAILVDSLYLFNKNIDSLSGINDFISLRVLDCSLNNIESLDLSQLVFLTALDCSRNDLTMLDISQSTDLTSLDMQYNLLTSFDFTPYINLQHLNCFSNYFTNLNVSQNVGLTFLRCGSGSFPILDITQNTNLLHFECDVCPISSINLSQNVALTGLVLARTFNSSRYFPKYKFGIFNSGLYQFDNFRSNFQCQFDSGAVRPQRIDVD